MRGNTLANVLSQLKSELGATLTAGVATAQDQILYNLIDNKQQWLAGEYDWPFLCLDADVTASSRYPTLPTTLDFSRLFGVSVMWSTFWKPVGYGIGPAQYNALSSGDGSVPVVQRDPIEKWRYNTDATKFEVWPVPSSAQTVRFSGVRPLATLKTSGSYDPTKTLDLDDLMVVFLAAAEYLARTKPDQAKLKLDLANQRIRSMRATSQVKDRVTSLIPDTERPKPRVAPLILIA